MRAPVVTGTLAAGVASSLSGNADPMAENSVSGTALVRALAPLHGGHTAGACKSWVAETDLVASIRHATGSGGVSPHFWWFVDGWCLD